MLLLEIDDYITPHKIHMATARSSVWLINVSCVINPDFFFYYAYNDG